VVAGLRGADAIRHGVAVPSIHSGGQFAMTSHAEMNSLPRSSIRSTQARVFVLGHSCRTSGVPCRWGACTTSSPGKAGLTGMDIEGLNGALYFACTLFSGGKSSRKIGGEAIWSTGENQRRRLR
jgi:hypothetical protein